MLLSQSAFFLIDSRANSWALPLALYNLSVVVLENQKAKGDP
jgi:hypothetical protein